MKYVILNGNGSAEIREDSYPLQDGAVALTDEQYKLLISETHIFQNGEIVVNPKPPKLF